MADLKRIEELAGELFDAETDVQRLDAELKAAQKRVQRLAEFELPEAMDDAGMAEIKTKSGLVVSVANKLSAKKLTERHAAALAWLRENGQGGLIKTLVGIPFTAGSEADADELVDRLAGEGIAALKQMEVHHSSLAATLKTLLEQGVDVPMELLGGYQRQVASVRPAKS